MKRFEELSKEEQKVVMSGYKKAIAKAKTRSNAALKTPMRETSKHMFSGLFVSELSL